jgi:uncharacterized protein
MDNSTQGGNQRGLLSSPLVGRLAALFLIVATVFVGAKALNAVMNIDSTDMPPSNVITASGEGKVSAVPDIAQVSFTVSEEATTASQAQDAAAKKMNVALAVLEELEIAEEDIKTSSYTVSPKYSYQPPCREYPCPYQNQKIIGFTAAQTVEVKIRNLDNTGKVLTSLGDAGISSLYGPNFTIEDEDELRAEAREEAIKEARAQAKELARQLGVRLVRIVSYSEGGYPMPYYAKDMALGMGGAVAESAPSLPTGENEIVVNVSVTYEIR